MLEITETLTEESRRALAMVFTADVAVSTQRPTSGFRINDSGGAAIHVLPRWDRPAPTDRERSLVRAIVGAGREPPALTPLTDALSRTSDDDVIAVTGVRGLLVTWNRTAGDVFGGGLDVRRGSPLDEIGTGQWRAGVLRLVLDSGTITLAKAPVRLNGHMHVLAVTVAAVIHRGSEPFFVWTAHPVGRRAR